LIDDEDGKVRRNLVVYSTLVIVVTFLGIQPMQILLKLIGDDNGKVEPWRVWSVSAAVLFYLWHRFSTAPIQDSSEQAKAERATIDRPRFLDVWEKLWTPLRFQLIKEDIEHWNNGAPQLMRAIQRHSLQSAYELVPLGTKLKNDRRASIFATFSEPSPVSPKPLRRNGTFQAIVQLKIPTDQRGESMEPYGGTSPMGGLCYVLPRSLWLQMLVKTIPAALLTTDDGLQHNFPRLLAQVAAGCIAWQLFCIVWVWWRSGTV
jgi:hypothetical protein